MSPCRLHSPSKPKRRLKSCINLPGKAEKRTHRNAMQVDIGFSDVIAPAPAQITYPSLLEQATAELIAYNRETAIAEKYEAMVKLAELNSRMKDFFDIAVLAANFEFEAATLGAAIIATFERRGTQIDPEPVCFSDRFAADPLKAAQ